MISIVLATYNGEKYILEQLESILNQTYQNFYIIIVDDNSSDKTVSVIKNFFKFKKYDKYSLYINEVNLGPTKSFEKGVRHVKTEYIAFCDQDDIWFENKLELYMENIYNCDLVYATSYILKSNISKSEIFPKFKKNQSVFGELAHNNARGATIMLKTELAIKLIPYHDLYDKWVLINSKFVSKIKEIKIPLHYYRLHDDNVNGGGFRKRDIVSLLEVQKNNIFFYEKMHEFLLNSEINSDFDKNKVLYSISKLIQIFEYTIVALKSKNKIKSIYYYFKSVAFVDFTFTEKAIYLYYFLFKYN